MKNVLGLIVSALADLEFAQKRDVFSLSELFPMLGQRSYSKHRARNRRRAEKRRARRERIMQRWAA